MQQQAKCLTNDHNKPRPRHAQRECPNAATPPHCHTRDKGNPHHKVAGRAATRTRGNQNMTHSLTRTVRVEDHGVELMGLVFVWTCIVLHC